MSSIDCFIKYKKTGSTIKDGEDTPRYCFEYMEDWVKEWKWEHITKNMIINLPWDIFIWSEFSDSGYMKDHYWKDIIDWQEWYRQRNEFVDYLYEKYKR